MHMSEKKALGLSRSRIALLVAGIILMLTCLSAGEPRWDAYWDGKDDLLPPDENENWSLYVQSYIEDCSISGGVMTITDGWPQDAGCMFTWDDVSGIDPDVGITMVFRARKTDSTDENWPAFGEIKTGHAKDSCLLYSTYFATERQPDTFSIDPTQWHIYRILANRDGMVVYVDESGDYSLAVVGWSKLTSVKAVIFGFSDWDGYGAMEWDWAAAAFSGVYVPGTGPALPESPTPTDTVADTPTNTPTGTLDTDTPTNTPGWDALWTGQGDQLPPDENANWGMYAGTSSANSSVSGGIMTITDDQSSGAGGSLYRWGDQSAIDPDVGITMVYRVRKTAAALETFPGFGEVKTGHAKDGWLLYSSYFGTERQSNTFSVDATQWHIYRILANRDGLVVHLDEQGTPSLTVVGWNKLDTAKEFIFGFSDWDGTGTLEVDWSAAAFTGLYEPGVGPPLPESGPTWTPTDTPSGPTDTPTDTPPAAWDALWTGENDELPPDEDANWAIYVGSQSVVTVTSGIMTIVDDDPVDVPSIGGCMYNWGNSGAIDPDVGVTMVYRVRKTDSTGENLPAFGEIKTGHAKDAFQLYSDHFGTERQTNTFVVDGSQWHVYRILANRAGMTVYTDEQASPSLTITGWNRLDTAKSFIFGLSDWEGTGALEVDWCAACFSGLYGPGAGPGLPESEECVKGDLDNDGDWDLFDILRLVDIVLDIPPTPTAWETCAGDMDEDGDHDLFDILALVDKVLET